MLNFKEWLLINETKEEKALASELAGDALTDLSTVIPKNDKNTDKLLLLAAYYYSKNKNIQQIKTDMKDYIGYLNRDKMELINVDLFSKKPNAPWDSYLRWTEFIHMRQGEDADKEKSKFKPSDIDFQGQVPIMTSADGKIKVYESNNPEKCIILGRGQSFCISQPGNRMWQSYRDTQTSTFYFVYDDTRDDRLGIVVVDVRKNGILLTDKPNNTGTTLDPYTGQVTNNSNSYMRYLREKGIDVSKFVNIPKSAEEQKEHEELGQSRKELDWFESLSFDYKSKYIGRGHQLTNKQFDYLWQNKFTSLLTQYVKTGLLLNDYQVDKIASNRDLRDNYLHNRIIADQHSGDLSDKEYYLFSVKQKESYYSNMNENKKLQKAIKFNELDMVRYLVEEKGLKISEDAISIALKNRHLDMVKYLVGKGAKINNNAVSDAIVDKNLDVVKYLVGKGAKIGNSAVNQAVLNNDLDMVTYLVEKGLKIDNYAVENAAGTGNLELVTYLVEKGAKIGNGAVTSAAYSGDLDLVTYLVEKGATIGYDAVQNAAYKGKLDIVTYLVEKGAKISEFAVENAAGTGNLELVTYLVEKGATIHDSAVNQAILNNDLDMVTYLVEKGGKIYDRSFTKALRNGNLSLVKYLVKNGAEINDYDYAISYAAENGHQDIVDYLKSVKE